MIQVYPHPAIVCLFGLPIRTDLQGEDWSFYHWRKRVVQQAHDPFDIARTRRATRAIPSFDMLGEALGGI